jgi:hypothetical protein
MQSKRASLFEAAANLTVGIIVSWLLTFFVLPFFGYAPSVGQASAITMIFTIASIIRSYALRRVFNRLSLWNMTHLVPRGSAATPATLMCKRLMAKLLSGFKSTAIRFVNWCGIRWIY